MHRSGIEAHAPPGEEPPNSGANGVQQLRMSTADVPAREQAAFWLSGFAGAVLGMRAEPIGPTEEGFRGNVEAWMAPNLQFFRCFSDNVVLSRGPDEVGRRPWDSIWIYREYGLGARVDRAGCKYVTMTGDLLVIDADQTFFAIRAHQEYRYEIWMLSRSLLAPHLRMPPSPLCFGMPRGRGLTPLLTAYLDALCGQMSVLPPPLLEAVSENLARLVAIAASAPRGDHRQAVRTAMVERAKAHIARQLANTDLSAATVAAALGVSERTL